MPARAGTPKSCWPRRRPGCRRRTLLTLSQRVSLSKSRIDKAGRVLRAWWTSEQDVGDDVLTPHARVAFHYRATFQDPLKKVTVGVRQFVARESAEVIVGQRLKRMPQILNKLDRFSSMRLSQMEDIGGCRAILPGGATEVQGVVRRIRRNWEVGFYRDYVREPKRTGYRAVHVVVVRDGRFIEIQLRTPGQHAWAEAVERAAARTGFNLKDGEGPPELLTYFDMAAWAVDMEERGQTIDAGFERAFRNLESRVQQHLRRRV